MSVDTVNNPARSTVRRGLFFTGFLVLACAALGVEVVLLVRTNHQLQEQLAQAAAQARSKIEPGEVLDDFGLLDESGQEFQLQFGEGQPKSVFLIFQWGCAACERMFPIWGDVVPNGSTPQIRVLAVCLDEPGHTSEPAPHPLVFPVYSLPSSDAPPLGKVSSVPTTLIVDQDGVVEHAWTGFLSGDRLEELRATVAELVAAATSAD